MALNREIVGVLQKHYGWGREQAEQEIDRIAEFDFIHITPQRQACRLRDPAVPSEFAQCQGFRVISKKC